MSLPRLDEQVANELVAGAVAHMQLQVGQVAETQAALTQLWRASLDPANLVASYERFAVGAVALIYAARARGQLTAQQFYIDQRALAGITDEPAVVAPITQNVTADLASLYSTGYATAKQKLSKGASTTDALEAAQSAVLGAASRRILDAPRQRLMDLSQADGSATGWARVGDGDPCYFCAMLIGRGPVYHSEQTANFRAHDQCGCNARLVFANDPSKGWTNDSNELHRAWYKAEPGQPVNYHSGHTLSSWRSAYADMRADPTSPVSLAVAGPRTAYVKAA